MYEYIYIYFYVADHITDVWDSYSPRSSGGNQVDGLPPGCSSESVTSDQKQALGKSVIFESNLNYFEI